MKVLVVHTSRIGDLVSGMGVVNFLREKFGKVYILSDPRYRGLFDGEQGIVAVTPEEAHRQRYEYLIDLSSSKMSAGYTGSIPANRKICLFSSLTKKIRAFPLYNIRLKRTDNHLVRTYSPILRFFGRFEDPVPILTNNRNPEALRFLEMAHGGRQLAGIHFDAAAECRFLPEHLVLEIIKSLRARGIGVQLIGTRKDIALRLAERSGGYARWREFTLPELKTVIAELDIFIGSDSGPLHVASALRIPSIGIYGPNVSSVSGPLASCVRFVEIPLDCRPCNQNRKCPHGVRCLNDIPVEKVMENADRILASSVPRRTSETLSLSAP
jgi:ADP-heptose:LPS heptosyltransferase